MEIIIRDDLSPPDEVLEALALLPPNITAHAIHEHQRRTPFAASKGIMITMPATDNLREHFVVS